MGETGGNNSDAGGGGGAVGRVRINSATGAATVLGLVSPPESSGAFTTGPLPVAPG